MTDTRPPGTEDWRRLAAEDLGGRDPAAPVWRTPEGIDVRPV